MYRKVFLNRDKITEILWVFKEFAKQIYQKPCTLKSAVHSTQLTFLKKTTFYNTPKKHY